MLHIQKVWPWFQKMSHLALASGLQKSDDLGLLLESANEKEEQTLLDPENGVSCVTHEIWKEFSGREFDLVLCKTCGSSNNIRLNTQVIINIEYPFRPPLFSLSISGLEHSD